jgi:hypothetical protein
MLHDRLGPVRTTTEGSWRVNYTPAGAVVSLNYNSQFAARAATEDFVFRIAGGNARLVGYHFNAPTLAPPSAAPAAPAPAAAGKPGDAPASSVRMPEPPPPAGGK